MSGALADVDELRTFLDDPTIAAGRGNLMLASASALIRSYCGQTFDFVENDEVILNGTGTAVLLLPEVPVSLVVAVWERVFHTGEWVRLTGPEDGVNPQFEWTSDGVLTRLLNTYQAGGGDYGFGATWIRRARAYRVISDHGFETVPDELKAVCLGVAGRVFENPEGTTGATLSKYAYTTSNAQPGIGLYGPEMRMLDPFRIDRGRRAGQGFARGSGS